MRNFAVIVACLAALAVSSAFAADSHSVSITIKQHGFSPATLTVPANTRIEIKIHNARALPSEFESYSLNREKVVPGHTTLSLWLDPLEPGRYKFFDDFNPGVVGWIKVEKPSDPS